METHTHGLKQNLGLVRERSSDCIEAHTHTLKQNLSLVRERCSNWMETHTHALKQNLGLVRQRSSNCMETHTHALKQNLGLVRRSIHALCCMDTAKHLQWICIEIHLVRIYWIYRHYTQPLHNRQIYFCVSHKITEQKATINNDTIIRIYCCMLSCKWVITTHTSTGRMIWRHSVTAERSTWLGVSKSDQAENLKIFYFTLFSMLLTRFPVTYLK